LLVSHAARSPKSDDASKVAFRLLVPDDPRVTVRQMFGSLAAFAGDQMFMGLFGEDLFVRLDEVGRQEVLAIGGGPLEPMPGRPMREYVTLPDWRTRPELVVSWAGRALAYATSLPPKKR
jgi:TfoX/Sxy family transcriptional regulator of competence genes